MELLNTLAATELPTTVTRECEVRELRFLMLAGYVEAEIPQPRPCAQGFRQPPARVLSITQAGRQMVDSDWPD